MENHKVLDGLFAQVVINADYLFLIKMFVENSVQRVSTFTILTKRFLNSNPMLASRFIQSGLIKPIDNSCKIFRLD